MANGPRKKRIFPHIAGIVLLSCAAAIWYYANPGQQLLPATPSQTKKAPTAPGAGSIVSVVETKHFTAAEVTAEAKQNYGAGFSQSNSGVTRYLVTYRSTGSNREPITVYARIYLPDGVKDAPILAMAPGTTGIGDQCAGSLEQPATHNWANYQSHLMAYASKGYAGVITDYEGMRDPDRLHHYMVGELAGRAVIDSVRAIRNLPQSDGVIDKDKIFASGYSQGGHSVFWADKLAPSYAPEIKFSGIIGWGPVMAVSSSWSGVAAGSTLNWYGPYVLVSYADYYKHDYHVENILQPQFSQNLLADVTSHCIDQNLAYWGTTPNRVFTPQFLADLQAGNLPEEKYGLLQRDLDRNRADNTMTITPKLINQGQRDNVILTSQQTQALAALCTLSEAPAKLTTYPHSTHYSVMRDSFNDTLAWMQLIRDRATPPTSCPKPTN